MNEEKKHPSDFHTIELLIPAMILVGAYLILNGHLIPGGGFQGGAALAAVLISHFLISPARSFTTKQMQSIEKYMFLALVIVVILYILIGLYWDFPQFYALYMILTNLILGIKVFCGLSIIFIEFAIEFQYSRNEEELDDLV